MMDDQLAELDKLTRNRRRWLLLHRAFLFSQIALDAVQLPINPFAAAHAGVAIGAYTTSKKLGQPARPYTNAAAGALVHDAQRKLNLDSAGNPLPPTEFERLKTRLFGPN
jgi:hypothetical protein